MIRILVTAPLANEAIDQLNAIPEFEVGFHPGAALTGLAGEMREAEALVCADAGELSERALDQATELRLVIVCGGGRLNRVIMADLAALLPAARVEPAETFGFNGDSMEAEAWAYLAVRRLKELPVTFPGTTGAAGPMTGGVIVQPSS